MNRHLPYQPNLAYTDSDNKLIIKHSSGFYSCCTIRLRKIINWYNEHLKFPVVDSSRQWSMYKDEQCDITTRFFETTNSDFEYRPILFSFDTVEDQFSNYSMLNYNDTKIFVSKYFRISREVNKIKLDLIKKYSIDLTNTIAVCHRGTDKKMETGIPTNQEMFDKIDAIQTQYPTHKLLIQSDEIEFMEAAIKKYPEFIYIKESPKVSKILRAIQFHIPISQRVQQAQIFLAIMQILSKSSKVILNSGNVGMWVCLFRNNFDGVSQYLNTSDSKRYTKDNWIN